MSEKSEDAFRSIGEVASELGIPQHVLRFWETRFPQVKPLKRGGGRRYYRPEDVALLHGIRFLLYAKGFTIKGVQRLLREQGVRFVAATASGDLRPETVRPPEPVEQPSGEGPQARSPAEERSAPEPHLPDDFALAAPPPEPAETAVLPRETEAPERRSGLGSFLKRGPGTSSAASGAGDEQRSAQLQEVILDLLECKRILDQVR